eukprot:1162134-Pelagomonas_calceolata.AAC.6
MPSVMEKTVRVPQELGQGMRAPHHLKIRGTKIGRVPLQTPFGLKTSKGSTTESSLCAAYGRCKVGEGGTRPMRTYFGIAQVRRIPPSTLCWT